NAVLTPRTRLRLAKLVVEDHWTYSAAAKMFMVAPHTARKWADRYRTEGPEGMADRSSRPPHQPEQDSPACRASHRGAALAKTARTGPDRWPARRACLDRACGAGAVPDQQAHLHRPRHRGAAAALRASLSGVDDPRRRHQVR